VPCGITDPVGCVTGVVGGVAKDAASSVFDSIAKDFGDAAAAAIGWLWTQIDGATTIDLASSGIKADLVATGAIAAILCFGLFVIQVLASALRQDMSGLGRAARGLPVSFVGAAFAVASTGILLGAVDDLSDGVVQFALGTNIQGMGQKLVLATAITAITNPAGELLFALVLLAAVVVIWVAMMIRKMLIIVSAVFAPIAFSGSVSDISKNWVKKWIEFTTAMVFSKLILVVIFMVGLSVLDGAGTAAGAGPTAQVTGLAIGSLTLLMAGFAPWMAIKLVHFAGDSFHTMHAQAGAATAGARQAAAHAQKLPASAASLAGLGGASEAGRPATPSANAQATPPPTATGGPQSDAAPTVGPAAGGGTGPGVGASGAAAAAGGAAPAVLAGAAVVGGTKTAVARPAEQAGSGAAPSLETGTAAPAPQPPRAA
jgi:type IV secretion system protein TrbL